jgi:hypothetical protein
MINVKEAVEIGLRFADEFLGQAKLVEPRLEEVELEEFGDRTYWHVTVSFVREPSKLKEVLEPAAREYKVVSIDARTGQVHSMKIRQPV